MGTIKALDFMRIDFGIAGWGGGLLYATNSVDYIMLILVSTFLLQEYYIKVWVILNFGGLCEEI